MAPACTCIFTKVLKASHAFCGLRALLCYEDIISLPASSASSVVFKALLTCIMCTVLPLARCMSQLVLTQQIKSYQYSFAGTAAGQGVFSVHAASPDAGKL